MSKKLEYLEIGVHQPVKACVIWLHGLGATANDFVPIVSELQLPTNLAIRFIFPQAPMLPVTLNMGYVMPAWYDILGLEFDSPQDEVGIYQMEQQIKTLINAEIDRGISSDKIVLAGFSQGGAMALHTALRFSQRLAGIMVLSSYLPLADKLSFEKNKVNSNTPIFMAHGIDDAVLPPVAGQMSYAILKKAGFSIQYKTYAMAHEICHAEIVDIASWLQRILR